MVLNVYKGFGVTEFFLSANFCSAQVIGARIKDPKTQRIVANHCHKLKKISPPGKINLMNSFSWYRSC